MPEPTERSTGGTPGPVGGPRDAGLTAARRSHGPPALYTAEEAAVILRVKRSWLERRAAGRKIPFTMLGGGYRFTATHLAEIVLMHEEPPAPRNDASARSRTRRGHQHAPGLGTAPLRPRPRGSSRRAA